jgi:hypothetical protein
MFSQIVKYKHPGSQFNDCQQLNICVFSASDMGSYISTKINYFLYCISFSL